MNDIEQATQDLHKKQFRFFVTVGVIVGVALLALAVLWGPLVKPWAQERKGMANLAQKRYENMIQAEASAAEKDAAVLKAQAIAIVGELAQQYPEYRDQEFIGAFGKAMLNGSIDQTLYIPTRDSIPVLPTSAKSVPSFSSAGQKDQ